jgi:hypothetical protein
VAGTIGGTTWGVAKDVTFHPVRVLDCSGSGTWSGVIAGMEWAANDIIAHPGRRAVANMSLGGGVSASVNDAADALVAAGAVVAVAAGNENKDASLSSPASAADVITVAASDDADVRAYFSNFGPSVEIFAPGVGITSAWTGSATSTNTISGTSMASPHVAGAAAVYLEQNPTTTPAGVLDGMTASASGLITDTQGSPNLLLYQAGAPFVPECVSAADCTATSSCTDASCSSGVCVQVDNDKCECTSASDCDDGNICTDDACVGNTCSSADNGSCCAVDADCGDDGNSCTDEVCNAADGTCSSSDNGSCESCAPSNQSCNDDADCCSQKCRTLGAKANTCA